MDREIICLITVKIYSSWSKSFDETFKTIKKFIKFDDEKFDEFDKRLQAWVVTDLNIETIEEERNGTLYKKLKIKGKSIENYEINYIMENQWYRK